MNRSLLIAQIDAFPGFRVIGWDANENHETMALVVQNLNVPSPLRVAWETSMRISSWEQWKEFIDKLKQAEKLYSTRDSRPVIFEAEYIEGGIYYGLVFQPWRIKIGDIPIIPHPESFKLIRVVWEKL